jgi:hypothetical protein
MDLSPGRQRGLFVALVVLLAGLGIYLVGPGRHQGSSAGGSPSAPASGAGSSRLPGGVPAAPSLAGVPSAVIAPAPLPVPVVVKGANIYNWLPFTQQGLDAAANVTLAFAAADGTFTYTDTPATYSQRLSPLVTPTLGQTLEAQFEPPGAQQRRAQQHLVSKSSGTITRIASFGNGTQASITFIVSIAVQTTTNGTAATPASSSWDVTAVQVPGGWQVNDIEQAGVGNQ